MSRTLIKNGFIVTVDGSRAVHPGGFVATDGAQNHCRRAVFESAGRKRLRRGHRRIRLHRSAGAHQWPPASLVHALQGPGRRLSSRRLGERLFAAAHPPSGRRRDAMLELRRRDGNAGDRHHMLAQPLGDDHNAGNRACDHRAAGGARDSSGFRERAPLPH